MVLIAGVEVNWGNLGKVAAPSPTAQTSLFGSNNYIESGQSTRDIIAVNRAIEVETSISKTGLLAGQNTLATNQQSIASTLNTTNTNFNDFVNQVKEAFKVVLSPDTTIPGTANNTSTPSPTSKEAETPKFTDTIKDSFSQIAQTLGPIGIVAGIALIGVLVLRK